LVPFDAELTVAILARLFALGAIDIPGAERPAAPALTAATVAQAPPAATAAKAAATAAASPSSSIAGLDLSPEQARRIDELYAALETHDAFALLEVTRTADKKEIKRAYFKMSKEFHPDRYFGKNLGPYRDRLNKIFQSVKAAFDLLSDDARRAAYEESYKGK
jgi:hypothetical protein